MQGLRRSLFLITLPLVTLGCLASLDTAKGQIIPDNSLGAEKSVVNSNANIDQIDGGARRGANLFHSFQEFNVGTEGKTYFSNPAGIENILSRVTGENSSNIFGTLGVLGNANLFFINPNGIVFGPDARLDMRGSFLVSTANSLLFDGGLEFSASNPQAPPILAINIPVGLQFRENSGSIINQSVADDVGLQVDAGKTLSLVGGDISLDGGRLTAAGGQVALGSLAGAGTVGLNSDGRLSFPDGVTRGNVSLTNGAQLSTSTYAQGNAGSIEIKARSLTMNDQASLTTSTSVTQDTTGKPSSGGTILLQVDDAIKLDNSDIQNNVESGGVGKGGEIKIKTGLLSLLNGSQIQTLVRGAYENQPAGKGNAGNINIQANDVILEGVSNTDLAPTKEIFSSAITSEVQSNAQGNAGSIKIKARSLTMNDQASLTTSTSATQDTTGKPSSGGTILLQVDDAIKLDNSDIQNNVESGGVGKGGEIKIKTGLLSLLNGSQIQTIVRGAYENQPAGKGNAGNINIQANDVILEGVSNTDLAPTKEIFSSAITSGVQSNAQGNAGSIKIKARSLTMNDQASLTTSTSATQDTTGKPSSGGTILLQVDDAIKLDNSHIQNNVESGGVGKGSEIKIKTGLLSLLNGSQIQTIVRGAYENQPAGKGNAGNINIQANDVILEGVSNTDLAPTKEIFSSSIRSEVQSNAQGNAGSIQIDAKTLTIQDRAQLTSNVESNAQGNAGSIQIDAKTLTIQDRAQLTSNVESNAQGNAGSIEIKARSLTMNDQASLTTSTSATQDTTGKPSSGGTILLQVDDAIKLDNSDIQNNVESGGVGKGGEIKIKTGLLSLLNGSQIQTLVRGAYENQPAGKGNAGNINIQANDVILEGVSNTNLAPTKEILPSSIRSEVQSNAQGNAGSIQIDAKTLTIQDRAQLTSNVESNAQGNAGSIKIKARSLTMNDQASLTTSTFATQDTTGQPSRAGMISLQADDGIKLENSSYIFNNVESGAVGQGGEVKIKTGSLSLLDGSQIQTIVRGAYDNQLAGKGNAGNITIHASKDVIFDGFSNTDLAERQDIFFSGITSEVESGVKGNAGNIEITTPKDIRLDNKASIRANTSGGKGNITLHPRDLILRRNSNITTNATGSATGGNISINTDNLVALEDSDITANAEESYGGKVRITAKRIFRSKDSDITASSELGPEFSGQVKLNLSNVDPSHGLVELEKNVVDPSEQIAQNPCQRGVGSKFIITGRGGLPPSPNEATSGDAVRVDLVEPATGESRGAGEQGSRGAGEKVESTVSKPIVPAQGWIFNKNGEVILTAYDPTGMGSQRPVNSDVCPVP